MSMIRVVSVTALAALALAACRREPPPPPEPEVIVDTVVVTDTVAPPPPEGRPATICLATGQSAQIYIAPGGDTLVGPQRTRLRDLGGVAFAGNYASDEQWFNADEAITVNDRTYEKFGTPESRNCSQVRIVGSYQGVNVFADQGASTPYETVYVPVRPGVFQAYRTGVGAVRG